MSIFEFWGTVIAHPLYILEKARVFHLLIGILTLGTPLPAFAGMDSLSQIVTSLCSTTRRAVTVGTEREVVVHTNPVGVFIPPEVREGQALYKKSFLRTYTEEQIREFDAEDLSMDLRDVTFFTLRDGARAEGEQTRAFALLHEEGVQGELLVKGKYRHLDFGVRGDEISFELKRVSKADGERGIFSSLMEGMGDYLQDRFTEEELKRVRIYAVAKKDDLTEYYKRHHFEVEFDDTQTGSDGHTILSISGWDLVTKYRNSP